MSVTFSKTGDGTSAPWNRFRNALPKPCKPVKGLSGREARAWPGMGLCSAPAKTAVKRSVVGSGPIDCPGKSLPSRVRMNDVFPTEYWPSSRTMGLASKSAGPMGAETKWSYRLAVSSGSMRLLYIFFSSPRKNSLSNCESSVMRASSASCAVGAGRAAPGPTTPACGATGRRCCGGGPCCGCIGCRAAPACMGCGCGAYCSHPA
mmetsp:Transcript_24268/g.82966  ORF Transcript_24268/g.82966 Transcript_24268/m.82966 type:complete len:205 (-) Transcript_24268:76-690(-)